MQGDIEELQKRGMAAPPRPQGSEPPRGLPVEERLVPPPAPRPPVLRMEIRPPTPPQKPERGELSPPPPSPAIGPRPAQEGLSARERLFISPKPPAPSPLSPPAPPAPPAAKKIELEKPSFEPTIPPPTARWPKILLTALIVAALAGGTGGFFYWWLVVKQPPLPPPPPPLEKPAALIPIDESKDYIITLTETDELTKKERISTNIYAAITECNNNEPPGTFRRILTKDTTPEKEEYLNLYPLLNIMGIPNGLGVGIPDSANYTLFSYADLPYGGCRIGLVANINDIEESKKQLADWKPYIENEIESAMKDLLNITNAILTPATPNFQDNIYKNTKIRYKNYPEPSLSFDYAIYEPKNLLIFTTSRESMWAVIDKLEQ